VTSTLSDVLRRKKPKGNWLPRILASAVSRPLASCDAVDPLPQQVGVADVTRVFFDHVDEQPPYGDVAVVLDGEGLAQRVDPCEQLSGAIAVFSCQVANASAMSAVSTSSRSACGRSVVVHAPSLTSPVSRRRNQARSTSVICRTSPMSDKFDGGNALWRSCASLKPSHLIAKVAR
jgi:hypothetical protein